MTQNADDSFALTVDKFTFRFPKDLSYSDTGLWMRREGESAVKYSLVANSIKAKLAVEPHIEFIA